MTGVAGPGRAAEGCADAGSPAEDDTGVVRDPAVPSRGRVALVLTRGTALATALVVVFYTVPFTLTVGLGTVIRLVAGLVVVAVLLAWQVRAVARSPHPALRAVETLAVAVPLFLLIFAAAYSVMSQAAPASFSEELSRTDALYFVVTVFATVGFGDISPVSSAARIVVTVQMVLDLLLLGLVLRALLDAVEKGRARRRGTPPPPGR